MDTLFVYGTLRRHCDNPFAAMLARSACFLGSATVRGRLYRVAHYPGLVLSDSEGDRVHGELFRLQDVDAVYRALDEYEGAEFRRITVAAQLESGERVAAATYVYARPVDALMRIRSGEWTSGNLNS